MKKWNRKQVILASTAIALLWIVGTSVGVVINHNQTIHAQQVAKAAQKAKIAQKVKAKALAQQKEVASLLSKATAHPSDESIKAVNEAIAQLTNQKEKAKDEALVKGLSARLDLIKKAQAALKDYQAHATDANKQKAAQAAINNLKDKNDQEVRAQLQKSFDQTNQQAQEAAKKSNAQKAGQELSHQASSNQTAETPSGGSQQVSSGATQGNLSESPNAPENGENSPTNLNGGNGGGVTNHPNNSSNNQPVTPPSNGGGQNNGGNSNNNNNNNGGQTPPPPAAHVYQGWVKVDGAIYATKNFSTDSEATAWGTALVDSPTLINMGFDHSINYGVTQLS